MKNDSRPQNMTELKNLESLQRINIFLPLEPTKQYAL